jgi:transcriptional regulator with XRE-family HTH domain
MRNFSRFADRKRAIARRIRFELCARKLSQLELAKALGWNASTVCKTIAGRRSIRAEELATIADALGVTVELLVRNEAR